MAVVMLEIPLQEINNESAQILKYAMARHQGDVPVVLAVTGGETLFLANVSKPLHVDASQACIEELKDLCGEEAVAVVEGLDKVR